MSRCEIDLKNWMCRLRAYDTHEPKRIPLFDNIELRSMFVTSERAKVFNFEQCQKSKSNNSNKNNWKEEKNICWQVLSLASLSAIHDYTAAYKMFHIWIRQKNFINPVALNIHCHTGIYNIFIEEITEGDPSRHIIFRRNISIHSGNFYWCHSTIMIMISNENKVWKEMQVFSTFQMENFHN